MLRRLLAPLLGLLLSLSTAHAATYHVRTSGSDSTPCIQAQSASSPRRSITAGIACLAGGDTLIVHGGDYDEAYDGAIPSGLSATQPTTIQSAPGDRVVLKPVTARNGNNITFNAVDNFLVIDGINIDAGFNIGFGLSVGGSGNIYRNFSITGAYGQAVSGLPKNGTFCNLEIYNNGQYDRPGNPYYPYRGYHHGMYLGGEGDMGTNNNILIDNVYVHDIPDGVGLQLYAGGVTVRNSRIANIPSSNGIYLLGTASSVSGTRIENIGGLAIAGPGGIALSQSEAVSSSAVRGCEGGSGPPKPRLPAPKNLRAVVRG